MVTSPQRRQRREQQEQGTEMECDSECGHDIAIWRGKSRGQLLADFRDGEMLLEPMRVAQI